MSGRTDTHLEKKIFKIDVGNIPEEDVEEYIRNVVKKIRKGETTNIKFEE